MSTTEKVPTQHPRPRRPNWRGLVTLLILLSSIIVLISGVVMFIAPSGRVAREIGWTLLGLDRAQWQTLHLSFAIVFVAIGIFHLGFNWQGLLHHLRDRASRHLTLKWEAVVALAAVIWIAIGAVWMLPPASNLHDLNTYFRKTFWADTPEPRGTVMPQTPTDGKTQIPEKSGATLPEDHPPTSPGQACSDCHRR